MRYVFIICDGGNTFIKFRKLWENREMNIYKVQSRPNGWDTYDSFVCVADNESMARHMHPSDENKFFHEGYWKHEDPSNGEWGKDIYHNWTTELDKLEVTLEGVASPESKPSVILNSFNAG